MNYNAIIISDLHWGVMEENKMYEQYKFILYFIEEYQCDLIVLAGDYFDFKLYLDSKRAIMALDWFDELIKTAKRNNVKAIRMIKGTSSHDVDQLSVFNKYDEGDGFFKLFEKCTVEETLPSLKCIYCPDEVMNTRDYLMTYTDEILSNPDIGFFHGNFDVVLNKSIDMSELMKGNRNDDSLITSVTFPLSYFQKIVKYCWIGGHWHDSADYGNVHYTGSATRWIHGEDEPKGIGFISIDTNSPEYFYKKILNPIAPFYLTEEICPDDFDDDFIEELDVFIKKIDEKILLFRMACIEYHIKIIFYENEKTIKSQNMLDEVKRGILLLPQTKLVVKTKRKLKKGEQKESKSDKDYSFIKDKNLSISKMIYEFIKVKTGEEVPYDYIEGYVKKYSK